MSAEIAVQVAPTSAPKAVNLAEKIIARAAGVDAVSPGEIVTARVDLAMIHDSGGPRRVQPLLEELGVDLFDRSRVVLISDHYVPGESPEAQQILRFTRDWAQQKNVRFHDAKGICHVVLPEQGHLRPGQFLVGGDSHSCTGGAFGAYMFGIGATDMAGVLATGEVWLKVPETIGIEWQGSLPTGVCAKDMMLYTCGKLGMDGAQYQAIEYSGSTIAGMSMQERMTLSNMAAELGAQVGLIAPDATTIEYLSAAAELTRKQSPGEAYIAGQSDQSDRSGKYGKYGNRKSEDWFAEGRHSGGRHAGGRHAGGRHADDLHIGDWHTGDSTSGSWRHWQSDLTARRLAQYHFDAASLAPQVAAPHSPANAMAVTEAPQTQLDVAYIGACTGAKYVDLKAAARVLDGRKISQHIKLLVAPATAHDQMRATEDGIMQSLVDAGAQLLPNACGICAGYGAHRLAENVRCISSTARNFQGRMGANSSQVWLASPLTVAASAVTGQITDPREFLTKDDEAP